MTDSLPLKNAQRLCPICDSARVGVLHTQPFALPDNHLLPHSYDVTCCTSCGFVYADTFASQQTYDEYYAQFSKYDDAATSTGSGLNECDAARLRETAHDIAGFLNNPGARILDAGCAVGGLLHELQALNYRDAQGLDPSPASQTYAREHFQIHVETGSIVGENSSLSALGSFDCVVLSHVLEHVRDLASTFENLRRLTHAGSTLYLEVPDAARYSECLVAPFQDFNIEHINHFDAFHLDLLASRFGFERAGGGQKIIPATDGIPYPALFGWYRRVEEISFDHKSDFRLREAMKDYIRGSQQMLDQMESRLAALGENQVVVWGTGQLALKLLAQTSLGRAGIICFLDGNPINHGKTLGGAPIVAPSDFASQAECNDGSTPILIASTIHQAAITRRIRDELGWNNPLVTLR